MAESDINTIHHGLEPLFVERHAGAYRGLESKIADARNASIVLETILEDTLESHDEHLGFRRFLLTEDQVNALFFATYQFGRLARRLYDEYHAAFDKAVSVKGATSHD